MLAQTLGIDSQLTKLRTTLVAIKPPEDTKATFDLQADVKTISRDATRLKLRFVIGIETFPLIYRVEMGGFAHANAEMLATDESLEDLGEAVLSDIILQVYRAHYEELYLTLSTLGLEAPSPWLVKDVHLVHEAPEAFPPTPAP